MHIYSPEERLTLPLFEEKGVEVFIKRDDMIHPFISGNKWRKLKYNIAKAKENKTLRIITFGGAWSNHLLATACAGAIYNIKTKAFVRGEDVSNVVLDMCKLYGMELEFVTREDYKNKQTLFSNNYIEGDYFIDEGGAGELAVKGCSELIDELKNRYDHIFCAAGTGATTAGLALGIQNHHLHTKLNIVPVLKGGSFIKDEIAAYIINTDSCTFHLDYHFGGYAKTNPQLNEFVQSFVRNTGIMIEPTYTGKALYALIDLVEKNNFASGSKILFVHTGGLTGLFGHLNKF